METIGDYKISHEIGAGHYGRVSLGFNEKHKVAIKTISKINETSYNSALNEISVMDKIHSETKSKYNSDSLLKFYNYIETEDKIHLIMQHIEGDLVQVLTETPNCMLGERLIGKIFVQLVDAVEFLHSINVIHNDIKPDNILIDRNNNIKLCDYGLCHEYIPNVLQNFSRGTAPYACPELLKNQQIIGPEADSWSIGVCLYVLFTGYFPFSDASNHEELLAAIDFGYQENINIPFFANDLISHLLDLNSTTRFSIEEIKWHPFYIKHSTYLNLLAKPEKKTIKQKVMSALKKSLKLK